MATCQEWQRYFALCRFFHCSSCLRNHRMWVMAKKQHGDDDLRSFLPTRKQFDVLAPKWLRLVPVSDSGSGCTVWGVASILEELIPDLLTRDRDQEHRKGPTAVCATVQRLLRTLRLPLIPLLGFARCSCGQNSSSLSFLCIEGKSQKTLRLTAGKKEHRGEAESSSHSFLNSSAHFSLSPLKP